MVPVAVLLSLQTNRAGHPSADMQRMDTAKPGEPANPSQEPQSRSEAQNLLLLQDSVCIFLIPSGFWKKPVPHCSEQNFCQASSVSKTFGHCARLVIAHGLSLLKPSTHPSRSPSYSNTTERAVIDQQIQLMQTRVQPYPTEDLRTADTSCPSRTSCRTFRLLH